MAVAAAMPLGLSTMADAQSSLIQKEIARRKALIVEADKEYDAGRKAYKEQDYAESVKQIQSAVNKLPQGPIAADRRFAYMGDLVKASLELSKKYRRTGRSEQARELLEDILLKDPGNVLVKKELEYLDDPIRTSPTLTYEHVKNVEKVRKSLYRAESYYNQAQFDHATLEYEEVLRVDPYNSAARRGMQRVNRAKSDYYRSAYDHTRSAMLLEVDKTWEIAVVPADNLIDGPEGIGITPELSPSIRTGRQLDDIILKVVDFNEDTTVRSAIDYLRLRAREADPKGEGVNIIFRDPRVVGGGLPGEEEPGFAQSDKIEDRKLGALKMRNVPLSEVLKQICDKTNLRYKIEQYAVVILDAGSVDVNQMYTRSFRVPPDFLNLVSTGSGDDSGDDEGIFGGGGGVKPVKPVRELLEANGIPFPDRSTASYNKARSVLTVRNTATNLDILEVFVNDLINKKPRQIKILSKFVEISQENTDELGFDWIVSPFGLSANSTFLGGGTVGSGTARTAADFISPVNSSSIAGVPTAAGQNVSNIVTGGNRSGDFAITRDSIDAFLNNPNRTAQGNSVAPGILSLTGLFTDGQVQMIMRGLNQKKGADIMTAPSILAQPGEIARIEIIREFIYPTEYEPPELPAQIGGGIGGGGAGAGAQPQIFPVTPANPTAFETRNTGVTMEVEPTLGDDGHTINLKFTPEIVEFEGFINYGSPIQSPATDALGNPITVTITENRIEMPVFSTRRVDTRLTIYDGHTVAVGGLMRENVQNVEDKVPILGDLPLVGRLFQTQAENHIKSNLIIFVTAQIIDATGQRVRSGQPTLTPSTSGSSSSLDSGLLPPIR